MKKTEDALQSLNLIKKKLSGERLTKDEIYKIIYDITHDALSDPEIALFISAMYKSSMNFNETIYLIQAIAETGAHLKPKGKYVVDKHSIGGIPGNRTTPIVVAICVAAGLVMPKTSSRAITTSAGTADVIETIAKVDFSMKELRKIVEKTGGCLAWGGAEGMVPADSKIIKIEKTLKVDPEAQMLASIMAKKLASGSKYILIDIPYGKTAKVTKQRALKLKKKFEKIGRHFRKKMKVVLTPAKEPMGTGVGPVLEMIDVLEVLDPKQKGPKDLAEKSIFLAGELLDMTGKSGKKKGTAMAREILESGKAFEKFKQIIKAQKGRIKRLRPGRFKRDFVAERSLKIKEINNKKINSLARAAGCPQHKSAGVRIWVAAGEKIPKKKKILTIYAESKQKLREAVKFYKDTPPIKTI